MTVPGACLLFGALLPFCVGFSGMVAAPSLSSDEAVASLAGSLYARSDEAGLLALADRIAPAAGDHPRAALELARACLLLARDRLAARRAAEALPLVARAHTLAPGDPTVALFRIWALSAAGHPEAAERIVAEETARHAERPAELVELALLLYHRVDFHGSRRVRGLLSRALSLPRIAAEPETVERACAFHLDRGAHGEARELYEAALRAGARPPELAGIRARIERAGTAEPVPPERLLAALLLLALAARLFGVRAAFLLAALFLLAQFPRLDATGRALVAAALLAALLRYRLRALEWVAGYYAAQGQGGAAIRLLRGAARALPAADGRRLRLAAAGHRIAAGEFDRAREELLREPPGEPARDALLALLHSRRRDLVEAHRHALAALARENSALAWQVRLDDLLRAGLLSRAAGPLALLSGSAATFAALDLKAHLVAGDAAQGRARFALLAPGVRELPAEAASWMLAYGALFAEGEERLALLRRAFLTHVRHSQIGAIYALLLLDAGRIGESRAALARIPVDAPGEGDFLIDGARAECAETAGERTLPPPGADPFGAFEFRRALRAQPGPSGRDVLLARYRASRAEGGRGIERLAAALSALEEGRDSGDAEPPPGGGALPFATDRAIADLLVRSACAAGGGTTCSIS